MTSKTVQSKNVQNEKAAALLALHTGGNLLILPNVWNPIGARILEAKGYPAVATASAAVSASLGYHDGERISRGTLIGIIGRIARSVDVPVTADIETGYGTTESQLADTIRGMLDAGVVGVDIADALINKNHSGISEMLSKTETGEYLREGPEEPPG